MKRFSFNQATAKYWPMPELVAGCVAAGVGQVGLWRENVAEHGLARTARLVRDARLTVTSLCRGGFFTTDDWFDDNRRAVDEAAALGTGVLVLVSGGLPAGSRDLPGARARVADAIGALVPHAHAAGVQLAIEPLHPMYCADRCVVSTLTQALKIAAPHPPGVVGVVVDSYHLWWDDTLEAQLATAGAAGRIAAVQLADWATPLPVGVLTGRVLPGQGQIDFDWFRRIVDQAGYLGPIEVEIFNDDLWARPGPEVLAETIKAYRLTDID